ncbi:MAG: signal peptidase I [Brevundimonas sp.]|nr:signal peptidase I [Brevundimonas sp.]
MSDENKPHDDHGHDAAQGRDAQAPETHADTAASTDAGHGEPDVHDDIQPAAADVRHDDPVHDEAAPDAHPVADAHAADHAGHGHEAHAEAAHGDHDPAVTPAEATVAAGAAGAAATSKSPVWSDSGDAPFEDVDATPVYARGKKGRKKGKSGGNETVEIIKTIVFALLIAFVLRVLLFQPFTIPSASMEPNLYEGDYIVVSKWSYGYSKHAIPFSPPVFEGRIFERQPERGDIVVFKLPRDNRTDYIKRLVGLPGDRVQMINNVLHINGEPARDVVISDADAANMYGMPVIKARETLPGGRTFTIQDFGPGNQADDTPVFEVPEGYYFMMGDNRDNSVDSRYGVNENGVGLVPAENLIGKAEIILFSWNEGASLWNPVSWFSKVRLDRWFNDLD